MAVFRVEKTKDFTVMSNHHLRNTELSLKAKGLLSLMLSLPEDWDYTTKGLAHICRDGVDSITTALKELERHGYLTRQRLRYENGQLGDIEYTIHEKPATGVKQGVPPKRENPRQVNPRQAKPEQAEPDNAKLRPAVGRNIRINPAHLCQNVLLFIVALHGIVDVGDTPHLAVHLAGAPSAVRIDFINRDRFLHRSRDFVAAPRSACGGIFI